jgi:electron transfer flavoprotein alpha subunit
MDKKDLWVVADLRSERLFDQSLRVLAKGRALAETAGQEMTVLLLASGDADFCSCLPVQDAALKSVAAGADRVWILEGSDIGQGRPDIDGQAIAGMVEARRPRLVLFALTDYGREAAAGAAWTCRAGLIADAVKLRLDDGKLVAACPSWGGEVLAEIGFVEGVETGFVTVVPHGAEVGSVSGSPGTIERVHVPRPQVARGLRRISRLVETKPAGSLENSEIVVVGGAGLGSLERFACIGQLAAALGGAVGATRPPVLSHWVEEKRLIGQTGKTVRPRLLISAGTSGAVQYTAGIMESGTIVAVNRDPAAPIFQLADIGIVADAAILLPILTERVKQQFFRQLAQDIVCTSAAANGATSGLGARIEKLRAAQHWSLEDLARETGQSPEMIAQVEAGAISPSVSFLLRLAEALKVDPGIFLGREEKVRIRGQRAQAFFKRTQAYAYQTLTPGAESDHLRAFLVTIDPKQDHRPVEYKHAGEEFIFVLDGDLAFTLGSKARTLRPGESIHFNSETPHKLKSVSATPTRCIVVLYTV